MKKFNFKAFFVDHGEKLGFGIGVLLVLLVLSGSSWLPYAKAPEEIIVSADKAKQIIEANPWPDDMRKSFTIQDYTERTRELRGPLSTAAYDYTTPLWQPLYRPQQLANEPRLLAVLDLEAKAGTFVMAVAPKSTSTTTELASTEKTTPSTTAAEDDEFAPARPATPTGGPLGFAGPMAGPAGHAGGASSSGPAMTGPMMGAGGAHAEGMGGASMMAESGIGEYGGGSLMPGVTGRGERFVSVRGVWPVYQQLQNFRTSLNLQGISDARALLEIVDFVLERKTATAAADPWSGPWQELEIARAQEILGESADYDIDIFDPRLVDVTITMPLPKRLIGRWGDYATHPQIKNFELKGPELERELKLQERLVREFEKMNAKIPQRVKRGGFANTQTNFRGMTDAIYSSPEMTNAFNTGMNRYAEGDSSGVAAGLGIAGPGGKLSAPDLKARLTAAERLFLFRYFDFDVRPGYAYRYRVKLKLRNPNYQRPLDQVIDKSVAEGEIRETEWSDQSTVAVVPETTNYFLRYVFRDPVQEAARVSRTVANLKMFQWDQSVGTMIADMIEVRSIGQFLGEKKKSWHLDVAKPSFKEEDVTFQTDDVYLDGMGDQRLTNDDHKDLKLSGEKKGMLGLSARALVLNDLGELKAIGAGAEADVEAQVQSRTDRERAAFEKIKGQEQKAPNPLDGGFYPGAESSSMMPGGPAGGPGAKTKGGKAKPNPRKMMPGAMGSGMMMP